MENGKFDDVDSVKLGKKKLNQTIDLKAKKKTFVRFDSLAAKIGSTGRIGLRNRRQCLSAKLNSIHFQKNSVTTVTTISTFFFCDILIWNQWNRMGVSERWSRRRPMAKRKCEWYRVFTEFLPSFWFFSLSLSLHFCGRHRRIGFHLPFGAVVSLLIFEKEREREREMRRRRSAGRPLWRRGADADAAKKQRPPPYPPQQQQQKKNWKKIERERENDEK